MTEFLQPVPEQRARDRQHFQQTHGIIGRSVEMRELVDTVMQVAPTDITVLITGESGTGKEVIANAIHAASGRADRRFVAVNCGAIPEGILESELFGHEKGSFTGATDTRKGYFEIADGGTIFLDEIGDTPISTQVKLLRVLENGEFMRVGSSEQRTVDVRVIAATNKDLEQEVAARRFRQDLYYRLRSVNIRIPPLRARRGDIPLLVEAFIREAAVRHPRSDLVISDDGMDALLRHPWPGNVRELRNIIESLCVLERGSVVDAAVIARYLPREDVEENRHLPMWLGGKSSEQAERELIFRALLEIRSELGALRRLIENGSGPGVIRLPAAGALPVPASYAPTRPVPSGGEGTAAAGDMEPGVDAVIMPARAADVPADATHRATARGAAESSDGTPALDRMLDESTLEDLERRAITRALARFDGNRRLAAEVLGISERTLYRKIKDYRL